MLQVIPSYIGQILSKLSRAIKSDHKIHQHNLVGNDDNIFGSCAYDYNVGPFINSKHIQTYSSKSNMADGSKYYVAVNDAILLLVLLNMLLTQGWSSQDTLYSFYSAQHFSNLSF